MRPRGRAITILVAEDDPEDCLLIREALERNRLANDLRFVGDGEELLDYLHRRGEYGDPESAPRPGLILLDLNMPRKDGREALREIKADSEAAPDPGRRADHLPGAGGHLPFVRPGRQLLHCQARDLRLPGGGDQNPGPLLVRDR